LLLHDDRGFVKHPDHVHRLVHRLMLAGDQHRPCGEITFDPAVDAEQEARAPMVETDPEMGGAAQRPTAEQAGDDGGQNT
jgi:hypothetical protein